MKLIFRQQYLLVTVFAAFILSSCSKDADEPQEEKEVILLTEMKNGDTRFSFDYNEENRAIKIELSTDGPNPQPIVGNIVYENGKASGILFKTQAGNELSFKFVYDNKGNVVESILSQALDTTWFTYDNEGRMTSKAFKTPAAKIIDRWTYDQNGNVKLEDTHTYQYWGSTNDIYADINFTSTHEYDDKRNPLSYNGVGKLLALIYELDETNLERILSYNNPKEHMQQEVIIPRDPTSTSTTRIYSGKYNNTYNTNGDLTKTVKHYKYETYIGTVLQTPNGGSDQPEVQYTLVKIKK